jgi:hypothetical protein
MLKNYTDWTGEDGQECIIIVIIAANVASKDLDIFAVRAVSLNHIYTHQTKIVNNICSYS